MRKDLFYLLIVLFLSFLLMSVNFVALKYNLFWILKWFDIPVHFLGGVLASFIFVYIVSLKKLSLSYLEFLFYTTLSVFFIGILWEIFEIVIGVTSIGDVSYISDTGLDIVADCLGAISVVLIVYNKKNNE